MNEMTAPTDTEKLAQALRELFETWLESRPSFRTTVEVQAAWDGWKANTAVAAMLAAHESRAQPASWPVELRAIGFNDAAAVIGYMDDIDAEVARITGDEGEDSSLQVLRRMPDYQPAQPASDFQPRFFIDHGVIHDRKRGRHVLGSQRDAETFGEPLQDTVDALNAMESATQSIGGLRVDYLDECRAQAQPASVADGWVPIDERQPPRNTYAVYWHKSDHGGFPAIADEWRDEHHRAFATHWHPEASLGPQPPAKEPQS